MVVVPLAIPSHLATDTVPAAIEAALARHRLIIVFRTTLKQYLGSYHWHARCPDETGTVELTWYPAEQRAWFHLRKGRTKPWVKELTQTFRVE